jgi:ABC-type branched-subunit amino acid transport system ATPase component
MLRIEDIHTYYGDHYILQGVSFEIGEGSGSWDETGWAKRH